MEDLVFRRVDPDLLQQTAAEWNRLWQDGGEHPAGVYLEPLESCRRAVEGESKTTSMSTAIWYAVVREGEQTALALADMIHNKAGSQLRLHRVIVAPDLELSTAEGQERHDFVSLVAATAIAGAIGLTLQDHPSSSLKIWCSFPLTKYFLQASLGKFDHLLSVQVAGNWLTINFKKAQLPAQESAR